jgi:hypothetical protein
VSEILTGSFRFGGCFRVYTAGPFDDDMIGGQSDTEEVVHATSLVLAHSALQSFYAFAG